jgi:uncharacterized integral membrane protein (TIGR00697 family)
MTGPHASRPRGNYDLVVAAFCGLLLISNIGATKAIAYGLPFTLPVIGPQLIIDGGAFLFPLTYVLGDVLAEVYGFRGARRAIWMGFGLAALAAVTFWVVSLSPPAPGWPHQEAWQAVLGFVPRIVLASLSGYLAGQFLNAYVLVRLKQRTAGRGLWARLLGSTVVGELADTVIFCTIAFAGILAAPDLLSYIVLGYLYKVAVEAILLPVTYAIIAAVRRHETDAPGPDRTSAPTRTPV